MSQLDSQDMRRLQIIVVALLGGAGSFLIIVAVLVITGEPRSDTGVLVPILFGAWAAVGLVVIVLLFPSQPKLERFLELGCQQTSGTTPR